MKMPDLSDLLCLVGLVTLTGGVWWIYPPAALIVLGLVLFVLGIILA